VFARFFNLSFFEGWWGEWLVGRGVGRERGIKTWGDAPVSLFSFIRKLH